ncbi:hypothetical protein MBANPS3_011365 [Mucor bainieri]
MLRQNERPVRIVGLTGISCKMPPVPTRPVYVQPTLNFSLASSSTSSTVRNEGPVVVETTGAEDIPDDESLSNYSTVYPPGTSVQDAVEPKEDASNSDRLSGADNISVLISEIDALIEIHVESSMFHLEESQKLIKRRNLLSKTE